MKHSVEDIMEVMSKLDHKPLIAVGKVYSMFGSQYLAVDATEFADKCDHCDFCDCDCVHNVDIPKCCNDVVFQKIKSKGFYIYTVKGVEIAKVKKIENDIVETTNNLKYSIDELLNSGYVITFKCETE